MLSCALIICISDVIDLKLCGSAPIHYQVLDLKGKFLILARNCQQISYIFVNLQCIHYCSTVIRHTASPTCWKRFYTKTRTLHTYIQPGYEYEQIINFRKCCIIFFFFNTSVQLFITAFLLSGVFICLRQREKEWERCRRSTRGKLSTSYFTSAAVTWNLSNLSPHLPPNESSVFNNKLICSVYEIWALRVAVMRANVS